MFVQLAVDVLGRTYLYHLMFMFIPDSKLLSICIYFLLQHKAIGIGHKFKN